MQNRVEKPIEFNWHTQNYHEQKEDEWNLAPETIKTN